MPAKDTSSGANRRKNRQEGTHEWEIKSLESLVFSCPLGGAGSSTGARARLQKQLLQVLSQLPLTGGDLRKL
jgi:hypothetical protein